MPRFTLFKQGFAFCLFLSVAAQNCCAADWPQWRGADFNGSSADQSLPSDISQPSSIRWSVEMPGESSATPVVVGDRVFVVSNGPNFEKLYGMCIDADTGNVLWSKLLSEEGSVNRRNSFASCSPAADEDFVYFAFGTGLVVALDHDGNEVWTSNLKDLGPVGAQFGYSSSTLLFKDRLYFPIQRGQWGSSTPQPEYTDKDCYLICLDAKTGAPVFRVHRPTDAISESFDSYASAIPYEADGQDVIVVQGGDHTTGHDPETGEEQWRFADNPSKEPYWRLIPTPVVIGDLIFNAQPRGSMAYAFNPGERAQRTVTSAAWTYNKRTTDVPTPIYYKDSLYILNGVQKTLAKLDPASGRELWINDFPDNKRFWASPSAGDDKLYAVDENGTVVVASIGDSFTILSTASLGGRPVKSAPALANGKVFIRTAEKLFCLGDAE
jgi:outer membrane protein assembly factor BamB